jgi:hypothetical protein
MTNTEPTDSAADAATAAAAAASSKKDIMVKLVSGDNQTFELPLSAAKHSRLVRDALNINEQGEIEHEEDDNDNEDEENPEEDAGGDRAGRGLKPVDCLRVEGNCLEKVVEFLKHYEAEAMNEIPVPLPANTFEEVRGCFLQNSLSFIHFVCLLAASRRRHIFIFNSPLFASFYKKFHNFFKIHTTYHAVHDTGMVSTIRVRH